jgi:uncharacterized membrane protein
MYIFLIILIYFIPTISAYSRKKTNASSILILNLFLGWTIIGWIVSLVWAVSKDNKIIVQEVEKKSTAQELEKLSELKEKGIITEEEFKNQKSKLLAK